MNAFPSLQFLIDRLVAAVFDSALTAIFSAAVLLTVSLITALLSWAKTSFPARLALRLSDPNTTSFIVATVRSQRRPYRRVGSGLGEIRAIGVLVPIFMRAYKTFDGDRILFSETVADGDPLHGNDVIILGGPKWNKIARQFLEKMPTSLPYTMDTKGIIDRMHGKRIDISAIDGKITEDYGLVIKTKNPFNEKARCFLFAGVHTYGVHAAALAFSSKLTRLRYLWCQNYACLVRCDVTGEFIGRPEIVEFRRIKLKKDGGGGGVSTHEKQSSTDRIVEEL